MTTANAFRSACRALALIVGAVWIANCSDFPTDVARTKGVSTPINISRSEQVSAVDRSRLLDAGAFHTCAITSAGTVRCWGYNGQGQTTVPADLSSVTQIGSGGYHTCALKTDGTVTCWGLNHLGQGSVPAGLSNVTSISVGSFHNCALKSDETVVCWGANGDGESTVPAGLSHVASISAGGAHTCAVRADSTAVCWGRNNYGQSTIPSGLSPILQISTGADHTCALQTDSLTCWGNNDSGQGQAGTVNPRSVLQVSAGAFHNCAVTDTGLLRCWGRNDYGQTQAPPLDPFVTVTAGTVHSCAAMADGSVMCWGENSQGQSSVPAGLVLFNQAQTVTFTSVPPTPAFVGGSYIVKASGGESGNPVTFTTHTADVCSVADSIVSLHTAGTCTIAANQAAAPGFAEAPETSQSFTVSTALQRISSLGAGNIHNCLLKDDGTITCWGATDDGRSSPPADVTDAVQLSVGSIYSCVLRSSSTLRCWGANGFGEAVPPSGLSGVAQVSAGGKMTCALKLDGSVLCWGSDTDGELVPPAGLVALQVSAGGDAFGCALKTDHTVVCWGFSGDGRTTVPSGLANVQRVSAGGQHACALTASGSVVCWGPNSVGQIDVPAGLTNVVQVSAGGGHSCALKSDGTVSCWGYNADGQATPPAGLAGVKEIAAGMRHTCARRTDERIVCWGWNGFGQTTVPSSLAPILQTISFTSTPPSPAVVGSTYEVAATGGGSGNAVTFSSLTLSTCTVSGNAVALIAPGTCTVAADQAGGDGYDAALRQTQSFNVIVQLAVPSIQAQIANGGFHTCALRIDGTVSCWGRNIDGQATVPSALASVARISGGGYHNCAIKSDGTVTCWGLNNLSQSTPPAGLSSVARVSAGSFHTCAIKTDASLVCWGWNALGQISIPAGIGPVIAVGAGDRHTCAVKADGTVACWGSNETNQTIVPAGLTSVVSVASGSYHSCALKGDGTVVCWGENGHGQLSVPAGLSNVEEIAAGARYTCARKSNGSIVCWGSNDEGQQIIPASASSLTQISTGYFHTCVLKSDGTPLCWGRSDDGQSDVPASLNLNERIQLIEFASVPSPAVLGTSFTAIATGGSSGNPVIFTSLTSSNCTVSGIQISLIALGTCSIAANQAGASGYAAAQQVVQTFEVTSPFNMLSRCGHAITGIAFDGTSYFIGEGHNSLEQCVSRYSTNGVLIDTKHFQVDIRGLHFVPASGLLTSRTWAGQLYSMNYSSGTQQALTSFVAAAGVDQSQPAVDPDGNSFWVLDVPGQTAQRRRLSDNTLITSLNVTGGLSSAPAIAVSASLVYVPNGSLVRAYDKVSGDLVNTISLPTSSEGCNGYGFGASTAGDRIMYSSACNTARVTLIAPPGTQTITFTSTAPSPAYVGSTYVVTATGGESGIPVVLSAGPSSVCEISGSNVTMTGTGTCAVVAHQAGANNYLHADDQTQSFTVAKTSQTITITSAPSSPTYGGTYSITATGGGSGNAITFTSQTPGTCSVNESTTRFVGAGSCTIAANQSGNGAFDAAPQVTQTFTVAKAVQTIAFSTLPVTPAILGGTYNPAATSDAGMPVTFNATGSCVMQGSTVKYADVGNCIVGAAAAGNDNYLSATMAQSFAVFYQFTGFASPIVNAPSVNAATAGSVIKVKFSLSGNRGLDVIAPSYPVSGLLTSACNAAGSPESWTPAVADVALKYDAKVDQYIYSWQTDAAWAGTCRQFALLLKDGSMHLAHFQFAQITKSSATLTITPSTAYAGAPTDFVFAIDVVATAPIQSITGLPCALPAIRANTFTYRDSCTLAQNKFASAGKTNYTAQLNLQEPAGSFLSSTATITAVTPPAPVVQLAVSPSSVNINNPQYVTLMLSVSSTTAITSIGSPGLVGISGPCTFPAPKGDSTSYLGNCTVAVSYQKAGKYNYAVSVSVEGRSTVTTSNAVIITALK